MRLNESIVPTGLSQQIELNLQVTALWSFHSHLNWCYWLMWPFSDMSEDPEGDTVMEIYGAMGLYASVWSLMHAI